MFKRIHILTLVGLFGGAVMPTPAKADTITVCPDGSADYLTIQEGIDAASDGDEVVVCDWTYTGTGNKDLDFHGKAITVRSENGPDNCIVDCENDGRGFYFHTSESRASALDGLTIRNGYAGLGGAVYCSSSDPTIINCTVAGNSAEYGAGVYCDWASPLITNCAITANTAAGGGGGVCCQFSSTVVTNCLFSDNVAGDSGGGMFAINPILTRWGQTLSNCSFRGSAALNGSWAQTLSNCSFSGNAALNGKGGAVYANQDDVTLSNCILWGDVAGGAGSEIAAEGWWPSTVTVSYCDVQGGEAAVHVEPGSMLDWGPGNLDAYPFFANPSQGDYHLLPSSSCIDAGCNCGVPPDTADLDQDGDTDEITPLDLDDEGRFFDDPDSPDTGSGLPPIVDMGAYEFGGTGPQPCVGDLNGDGIINLADLGILLANYGTTSGMTYTDGDLNCDCAVDLADLGELLGRYGTTCP
jgi:predicted outer membrane repeat protein